jgi:hypothetical protein
MQGDMYLLKQWRIEQIPKGKLGIEHHLFIGDLDVGYLTVNIFGRQVSNLPYVFKWIIMIGQPEPLFYCSSINEGVEVARMEIQELIGQLLQ